MCVERWRRSSMECVGHSRIQEGERSSAGREKDAVRSSMEGKRTSVGPDRALLLLPQPPVWAASPERSLTCCWHRQAAMGCCSLDPSCHSGPPRPTASSPSHLGLTGGSGQETIFLEGATMEKSKGVCCWCKRPGKLTWISTAARGLFGAAQPLGWGRHGIEVNQPSSLGSACAPEEWLFLLSWKIINVLTDHSLWHFRALSQFLGSLGGSCARRARRAALEMQRKAEK